MALPAHAESRRRNLGNALRLVHERGAIRQVELSDAIGVSRGTGISLVEELIELGLLVDGVVEPLGGRGRPSPRIAVSEDVVVVTAEIAADMVRVDLVALGGSVRFAANPPVAPARDGPDRTLHQIAATVAEALQVYPTLRVVGVAIAVHGAVDSQRRIVFAPNLGWEGADLGAIDEPLTAMLPGRIERPALVGNDADLGALGERRRGAGRTHTDFVYLSAERGIGGGLVAGGRVILGASGLAGEVGHLKIGDGVHPCGCGGRGCWETEIGTAALARKARTISSDELLARADADDPRALAVIADCATWLGRGLGVLVPLLQPAAVVLGGHLARVAALAPAALDHALRLACPPRLARDVEVVPSHLGRDAALIGAAEIAFGPLLDDPAATMTTLTRAASA
ncbi:ROK family protein [Frankia sp. AgPm24]|uniref:ROK family protein n=1 Tax=Frankia sp. AgPm24 TaxID=631128 RepID=UPI00200F5D0F|nr:ROK family protein [Frankia sp. AgPm24]MCK9921318.1 ROK family protein [Frankia sp. AgPm24]